MNFFIDFSYLFGFYCPGKLLNFTDGGFNPNCQPGHFAELAKQEKKMAKIISEKYASKDDPIFTGRYIISNPKGFKEKVEASKTSSFDEKSNGSIEKKEEK